MPYSQKPLLDLLKAGKYPGETGTPKHIETVMSNVFIFDKNVYKLYKNDNDFINENFRDLSGKEGRFSFTSRDFAWNHALSPSIYTHLSNVAVEEGVIRELPSPDNAEEILICMNRADTDDLLFNKLVAGSISLEDSFQIGKQLGESLQKVQKQPQKPYGFAEIFGPRIDDVRVFAQSHTEHISGEESGEYCDFLENFLREHRELAEGQWSHEMVGDGDFHSQNALYSNGRLYLMDTFAPKEEWGVGHRLIAVYRIGVDIWALGDEKELFESFLKGYGAGSDIRVDRRLDDLLVIYASVIMVCYLYMLQRTDVSKNEVATRYHAFLKEYFQNIPRK
jgi:aminoglycoside phosphotransferase family enzyme